MFTLARTIGPIRRVGLRISILQLLLCPALAQAAAPTIEPKLAERSAAIGPKIDAELASLETLYKQLHAHPEISYQERQTAGRLAQELQQIGFEVTSGIGGNGLVGILKNGPGPTVLVRTDLD